MKNPRPAHRPLTLSLHAALAVFAPLSTQAGQLIITDGDTHTVADTTYDAGAGMGQDAIALAAQGTGSTILGERITAISGSGGGEPAVFANRAGRVDLKNSVIQTNTTSSYGVLSQEQGEVTLSNTKVTTTGSANSHGVVATIKDTFGGTVTLNQSQIETQSGTGIVASGSGSKIVANDTAVRVASAGGNSSMFNGYGAAAQGGGIVEINNGSVDTHTDVLSGGFALFASDSGSELHANGTVINVTGQSTHAIASIDKGLISLGGPERVKIVTLTNTSVSASAGPAVVANSNGIISTRSELYLGQGTTLAGNENQLITVGSAGGLAELKVFADKVSLTGDLTAIGRFDEQTVLDLALSNNSLLAGRVTNGDTITVDPASRWVVTGNSTVGSVQSDGSIGFAPAVDGTFKMLMVRGDYTGNGNFTINTALGHDASPTDKLVVLGNTSGNSSLHVENTGGTGSYTTSDGIQVVQVGGASNGTFSLDGRVVAGANEYLLAKGGKANPADGDWYLRSEAPPPPPPPVDPVTPVDPVAPVDPVIPVDPVAPIDPTPVAPDPTPVAPVVPPVPQAPLYRPEPAAYLANQAASVGMFEHSMHDRMGEPSLGKRGDDGRTSAGWVRVVRNQMDGTTGADQLHSGTDTSVLQIGGEIARWNDDSRFHLGLMGGTGRANSLVVSDLTDYRAKGKVIGYNLGVYGTWFANAKDSTGLYLDGWLQYGRYDNNVQGDYLADERYDSHTLAASVEAGYAVRLNGGGKTDFYIEPQAQAIFTDYSASKHVENNGTVIDDIDAGGWTTRVGMRFYGHATGTTANIVQPFVTLNWWRDADRNVMSFNDTTLALELPRDRYEAKLGAQAQLGGGWTGWGNLGLAYGAGDYHDVTGQLGLNYRW